MADNNGNAFADSMRAAAFTLEIPLRERKKRKKKRKFKEKSRRRKIKKKEEQCDTFAGRLIVSNFCLLAEKKILYTGNRCKATKRTVMAPFISRLVCIAFYREARCVCSLQIFFSEQTVPSQKQQPSLW